MRALTAALTWLAHRAALLTHRGDFVLVMPFGARFFYLNMAPFLSHPMGHVGERVALAYLRRAGHFICARNWRSRQGELDLIACDHTHLIFLEVKTRKMTHAARFQTTDAVTPEKQARIRALSAEWLRGKNARTRFDILAVHYRGNTCAGACTIEHHRAQF